MSPKAEILAESVAATTTNGKKLLDDANFLFDLDRFSTAFALAVLAQEEFAKAFLLQLVADKGLPWLPEVQRSMAKHQCKHLLAVVMDWLPRFDIVDLIDQHKRDTARHEQKMAWLQRRINRYAQGNVLRDLDDLEPMEPDVSIPQDVVSALNIYRHEEIERLRQQGNPWKDEDWATGKARKIAEGALDKKKQSALYVDITKTGEIGIHPGLITRAEAREAIEGAKRLADGPAYYSDEYRALKETLPAVFANLMSKSDDVGA